MFKKIENPAACEMRSVSRFLNAKNMTPAKIHRQLCDVYGKHAMSSSMVRRWVRLFNEGGEDVHDDPRSGRPSVVNEYLVRAVEAKIRENRRFTIKPLSLHFPQISRSLLHKIVSEVKEAFTTCFVSQAASFHDEGRQKLVQRYDKCLNNGGKLSRKVVYGMYIKWQYTWSVIHSCFFLNRNLLSG